MKIAHKLGVMIVLIIFVSVFFIDTLALQIGREEAKEFSYKNLETILDFHLDKNDFPEGFQSSFGETGEILMASSNDFDGDFGRSVISDDDGQQALAVWQSLPDRDEVLVAKMDFDEAFAFTDKQKINFIISSVIVLIFAVVFSMIVSRSLVVPIKELTEKARLLSKGDMSVQFSDRIMESGDEVTDLAKTFSLMSKRLGGHYDELETKVRERTIQLEEAKAKDDAILESIADGVLVSDVDGKIVLINNAAAKLLEVEAKKVMGRPLKEILRVEDSNAREIPFQDWGFNRTLASGSAHRANLSDDLYYRAKEGRSFPVVAVSNPLQLNGEMIGAVQVFRDITEEKAIDRAKTEFISLASHQLRTPLSIISWYAETLVTDLGDSLSEDHLEFFHEIMKAKARMSVLVRDLLNVSRLEMNDLQVNPQPIKLKDVFERVVAEFENKIKEKKLKVDVQFDSIPELNLDEGLMFILLNNLFSNAVKYSFKQGEILVKFELDKGADRFAIIFADKGCGVDDEDKPEIFSKMFRGKTGADLDTDGNGLGLYIVKEILDRTDGKIFFESAKGEGSTFKITLPLSGMKPRVGKPLI